MDALQTIKSFEARLKECELKLSAVLELMELDCQYTPEKYTLVKPEGEE